MCYSWICLFTLGKKQQNKWIVQWIERYSIAMHIDQIFNSANSFLRIAIKYWPNFKWIAIKYWPNVVALWDIAFVIIWTWMYLTAFYRLRKLFFHFLLYNQWSTTTLIVTSEWVYEWSQHSALTHYSTIHPLTPFRSPMLFFLLLLLFTHSRFQFNTHLPTPPVQRDTTGFPYWTPGSYL